VTGNSEVEHALRTTLEAIDANFEPLRIKKSEAEWQVSISDTAENRKAVEETKLDYRLALANRELFNELTAHMNDAGVQDLLLRRWAGMIRLEMAPFLLPGDVVRDIVSREAVLDNKISEFEMQLDGETVKMDQLNAILADNSDMALREKAWAASKEVGKTISDNIRELVRARNVAARSIGFPDYYRMNVEIQEIDEARLFSSLGNYATMTEELYRRMKARMDQLMADHFRIDAIDLAPWHYSETNFQKVPPVFGVDINPIFQGRSTIDWIKEYFASIGLPIDGLMEKGDFFARDGKRENSFMMNIDRADDIRTFLNIKDNPDCAEKAVHQFGKAVYQQYIDQSLPTSLKRAAHPALTEGIASFLSRQVTDIEWMIDSFGLTGAQIREMENPLKEERQFQIMVNSRWNLVMIHFERGLYRDPDQDQQGRWWDLVERFQLVRRPKDRKEDQDWASIMNFSREPVYYHNYMLGEWLASHLHYKLQDDFKLKDPIVWRDNERVGEWLKENIFKHGALWEMTELIRNAMGGTHTPDFFVNQFFR